MMWQTVIVGIIIAAAASFTLARLVKFFANPSHKCDGCSGCSLADLKNEIEAKKNH